MHKQQYIINIMNTETVWLFDDTDKYNYIYIFNVDKSPKRMCKKWQYSRTEASENKNKWNAPLVLHFAESKMKN